MSEQPRYASLQDYVRVLRRHRLLIAALTAVGALGLLGLSLAQPKVYEAEAVVSFRDPLSDVDIFSGDDAVSEVAPFQRATINAELITRNEVTQRVRRELDTALSADELAEMVDTRVNVQTNLVTLTAQASDAEFAAAVANTFARVARDVGTASEKERIENAEELLQGQLEEARQDLPESSFQFGVISNQLQRVELLSRIAEPVRIEQDADPPESPVSPKPARDAVLGGIVGLLLGLLAAFVREALDRRVRSPHEVQQELGFPVVGRVRESAFGYHGLVRNGSLTMLPEDFEAFRVLRTNLSFLRQGGPRTVLVTSAAPEEGKTTVSVALASAAAVAGQRVLLVEADLRRPCFARRLHVPAAPGLTDYLLGDAGPQEILTVLELMEPPVMNGGKRRSGGGAALADAKLVCITAGTPVATAAELLDSERFDALLDKLRRAYDLVILDSSPILAVADPLELASDVDTVLVCVRADQTTREQLRATREALARVPDEAAAAVLTGLKPNDPNGYGYYYGY
jgi:polysaccharide biosynthesis transport protein